MNRRKHADTATLDEVFDILGNAHRRRMLTRLHDANPRDEDELSADALASDADDPDPLAIEFDHRHLPKLADAGFIDWDREEGVVRRGPRFDEVAPLIELMVDHEDDLPSGWP